MEISNSVDFKNIHKTLFIDIKVLEKIVCVTFSLFGHIRPGNWVDKKRLFTFLPVIPDGRGRIGGKTGTAVGLAATRALPEHPLSLFTGHTLCDIKVYLLKDEYMIV